MMRRILLVVPVVCGMFLAAWAGTAVACGGFFCQTDPVDQAAERIVFTVNNDGTITSLIEIAYEGSAADFSWILPIPAAIGEDDLAVPDNGAAVFEELHRLTDPVIIAPPEPDCAESYRLEFSTQMDDGDAAMSEEGVEVFASGEVGPFGFDVIGADDPDALVTWLRDNNYTVDQSMEPLMNLYVDEQFAFLAMRLLDGETNESITPIEITYPGTQPMIPLRLTAIAAFPNMPIFTWTYADEQVVPENYGHFEIPTEDIVFFVFGGNNYRRQINQRADEMGGRAFITEYAGPAANMDVDHPYLAERANHYLTRLITVISPDEMTVDPMFVQDAGRADKSNIIDASEMIGLYDCERDQGVPIGTDTGGGVMEEIFGGGSDSDDGQAQEAAPARDQNVSESVSGAVLEDADTDGGSSGRVVATVAGLGLALGLFAWLGMGSSSASTGRKD